MDRLQVDLSDRIVNSKKNRKSDIINVSPITLFIFLDRSNNLSMNVIVTNLEILRNTVRTIAEKRQRAESVVKTNPNVFNVLSHRAGSFAEFD